MSTDIQLINSRHYGAEELQKTYKSNFAKGLAAAAIFHILFVIGYIGVNNLNADVKKEKELFINQYIHVDIDKHGIPEVKNDELNEIEKLTSVPEKIIPKKDLAAMEVVPVNTKDAEILTTKTQEDLDKITGIVSKTGDSTGTEIASNDVIIPDNTVKDIVPDNNANNNNNNNNNINTNATFFEYQVEKAPSCINLSQVKSNVGYPTMAIEAGIQGRVTISVLVNENGEVVKTGKLTGNEVFYDAVRDNANDLKFTPGLQNNKPVKVWVTIPFNFKLEN